ncbi:MAG: hypothetical protein KF784_00430 [Fimbriimonadaceae bacterium]|nr:hypothetical protein [Fimbriimonadaceae bacterium]
MSKASFPPNSRYSGMDIKKLTLPDGREVAYLARRMVPPPEKFATYGEVRIERGDRPDLVSYRVLGDSELYWRLADANAVLHPDELTEVVGRRIRIAMPEGIPSLEDADA